MNRTRVSTSHVFTLIQDLLRRERTANVPFILATHSVWLATILSESEHAVDACGERVQPKYSLVRDIHTSKAFREQLAHGI